MTNLSNIEQAYAATDAMIDKAAVNDAGREIDRIEYLSDVSDAYLAKTLRYIPRTTKKGKAIDATEGDYAAYALERWNAAQQKKLGKAEVIPVHPSRKSELSTLFKAVTAYSGVIKAARAAIVAGMKLDADLKVKTYDGIMKVARAQIKAAEEHGADAILTEKECIRALYTEPKDADEEKEIARVIKSLKKLQETFAGNEDAYQTSIENLENLLATIVQARTDREEDEAMAAIMAKRAGRTLIKAFEGAPANA